MRRRARTESVEPPARLVAYDTAEWLPLVDPDGYDPERYRNRRDGESYGEPRMSLEDWRHGQAWGLWTRARHDWCQQHGWPGGLDIIDLFRQEVRLICDGNGRRRRL